jgi:hypothetical protein
MRQINDHLKSIIKLNEIEKQIPKQPKQPKPSFNPFKWNWIAIITWSIISVIVFYLLKTIL